MNATALHTDVRQHILDTARPILGGKGFSAVGLNEILAAAGVPKGSFYHYFESKEAFGEALLERYFATYLMELDVVLDHSPGNGGERLLRYWQNWADSQSSGEPVEQCLAVKLGAEVCDLSERMRVILEDGTGRIVARLTRGIQAGRRDGSLAGTGDAADMAMALYQLWLGASLLAKIAHDQRPFEAAMATTRRCLGLGAPAG